MDGERLETLVMGNLYLKILYGSKLAFMLIRSVLVFLRALLTKLTRYPLRGLAVAALLLILNSGCSQVISKVEQLPALLPNGSIDANFQIRVIPSERSGVYTITGTTNLPDNRGIGVAAIRYLRQDHQVSVSSGSKLTYSILAYQDTKVKDGQWQATLNLWNVARDGRFQEPWQLEESKLGLKLEPESDVTFLATLAPTEVLAEIEDLLKKEGIKLAKNLIRRTIDGQRYVQATQILPIPLPTASTTPPPERPEDVNGGWGPRYILLPEPPNTKELERPQNRRTDAPLKPSELMQ